MQSNIICIIFIGLSIPVEADKPSVDPSAESAAPAANSSDDKPKEDVVENNSPAPVEASAEEKTDDEGLASNKTSVESLKETNENNSNNVGLCHRGGQCSILYSMSTSEKDF